MSRRIFVIGSGQSNALGGEGGNGGDQTTNSRVKVWNNGWVVASLGVAPFAVPDPPENPPRNNAIWNFCKRVQETQDADVYLVLQAKGATPISAWAAPSGDQWTLLNAAALAAMASPELAGIVGPNYFIWFQGEADGGNNNYKSDFLTLRNNAIAAGWLQKETPVIAGEILNDNALSKWALFDLLDDRDAAWFNIAPNEGVERVGPESAHFTGNGYVDYGRRQFFNTAMNTPRVMHYYKAWQPTILGGSSNPTVAYDLTNTFGGSYRFGNLVQLWFKIRITAISRGGGTVYIGGAPYPMNGNVPANGAFAQTGTASEVGGLNSNGAAALILKTAGGNGIKLMRSSSAGTSSLTIGDLSDSFTMVGSLTYFTK